MEEFTIICVVGIIVMYALQLVLLLKSKRWVIRLIPLYIYIVIGLFALACYTGVFGGSGGFIDAGKLLAILVVFMLAIWLIGIALAYIVYGIYRALKKTGR